MLTWERLKRRKNNRDELFHEQWKINYQSIDDFNRQIIMARAEFLYQFIIFIRCSCENIF